MADTPDRQQFESFASHFPHKFLLEEGIPLAGDGSQCPMLLLHNDMVNGWYFSLVDLDLQNGRPPDKYWHNVELREDEIYPDTEHPPTTLAFPVRAQFQIPRGFRDMASHVVAERIIEAFDH
jgi:hypothetical protein